LLGYVDDGVNPSYWTSLSSSVVNDISIPVWTRNNNGTPTAEGFKLNIVDIIDSHILLYMKRIKFLIDGVPRFLGTVDKAQPQKSKRIWEYEILNGFYELTKYKIESSELLASLINTNDPYKFQPYDGQYSNVSVPWLLEVLLIKRGLTCDVSALYLENSDNQILLRTPYTYWLKDIRLDLAMLFILNQPVAVFYTTVDSDNTPGYSFSKNKINAFDLFVLLCAVFSITIRFEATQNYPDGAYILERRKNAQTTSEQYIINQSDIWEHSQNISKIEEVFMPNFEQRATQRANYLSYIIRDLQSWGTVTKGKGRTIQWYDNLIFLMQDKTQSPGITLNMDTDSLSYNDLKSSIYFKEDAYSETETELICPIQDVFFNVKSHFINPRRESSIVKQGVFI